MIGDYYQDFIVLYMYVPRFWEPRCLHKAHILKLHALKLHGLNDIYLPGTTIKKFQDFFIKTSLSCQVGEYS